MNKNLYTIYNQRLAGYLMLNGFPLINIVKNQRNNKNKFLFANNNLLHDYIDKWQVERLNNKEPVCRHCLRGMPEDKTISKENIDNLLNQTEIINNLVFLGGEPLIALDEMEYFIERLYFYKIPLLRFHITTNGLIYNDRIVNIIRKYSNMVKDCRRIGLSKNDVENAVTIAISIDDFHSHNDIVNQNIMKYKSALKGYATVYRKASGNIPKKLGNATNLSIAYDVEPSILRAVKKRIEILDATHKPLCPQYKTYKLIKPEQVIIPCALYVSANGDILTADIGNTEYKIIDLESIHICKTNNDIYESILIYNKNKIDCRQNNKRYSRQRYFMRGSNLI